MLNARVKQKRDWTETKNGFWAVFFREKNVKRVKGWTRNSRKSSKIKGLVTHTFSKKKKKTREQKKKKRKMTEREKPEDVFSNLLEKTFFQIHQKMESNKWETECLKEERKRKQKRRVKTKTRNHLSRHRKTRQSRKK